MPRVRRAAGTARLSLHHAGISAMLLALGEDELRSVLAERGQVK